MAHTQCTADAAWRQLRCSSVKLVKGSKINEQSRFYVALTGTFEADSEEFVNVYLTDLQYIWCDSLTVGAAVERAEFLNRSLEADQSALIQCIKSAMDAVCSSQAAVKSNSSVTSSAVTVTKSELKEDEDDSLTLSIQTKIGTGSFRWNISAARIHDAKTYAETASHLLVRPSLCTVSMLSQQNQKLIEMVDNQRKNMQELDELLSSLGDAAKSVRKRLDVMRNGLETNAKSAQLFENGEFNVTFSDKVENFGTDALSIGDVQAIFTALLKRRSNEIGGSATRLSLQRQNSGNHERQKVQRREREESGAVERQEVSLPKRRRSSGGASQAASSSGPSNVANFDINLATVSRNTKETAAGSKKQETKKRSVFH